MTASNIQKVDTPSFSATRTKKKQDKHENIEKIISQSIAEKVGLSVSDKVRTIKRGPFTTQPGQTEANVATLNKISQK